MYTPTSRIILAVACVLVGTLALVRGPAISGWLLLGTAILVIAGYWRAGTVWLAWRAARLGNLTRAQQLLTQVPSPRRLAPQQRAYYDLLMGLTLREQGDAARARGFLEAAVAGRLRTENDRSLAHLHIAEVALVSGDVSAARAHLLKARSLSHRPEIAAALTQVETQLPAAYLAFAPDERDL